MELFVGIVIFVLFALLGGQKQTKPKDRSFKFEHDLPEEDIWDEQFDDQDDVDEDNEE